MNFVVKGWCPGALRPMMSGDGLVVRVRPHMARLTKVQAHGLALASLAHGNGLIDLTARGNLQLRGVRPEAHLALLDDLDGLGLIDADGAAERRRNIVVSPFSTANDGTSQVVTALMQVLAQPEFASLPSKFGFAVDTAGCVLQQVSADIRIERSEQGWLVRPDGFATGALVKNVGAAVAQLLTWFLARGVVDGRGRMAALAGRNLPAGFNHPYTPASFAPQPGGHDMGHMVGFAFGEIPAQTLLALAKHDVRITPWRMILIEGATSAPDLPGLIVDAADPRQRVTACTGAPGCPQALQPTRQLAACLAQFVSQGQHLHVSGCAKGCAHPGPADVTLVATIAGFDLIRNGRAADKAAGTYVTGTNPFKVL